MEDRVCALGFTWDEFHKLRRISMTLHRWHEHEANGNIQRDGDDGEGLPRWFSGEGDPKERGFIIPDRERGALKRLAKLMEGRKGVWSYIQGDCRGAALYLGLDSDLRGLSLESAYNRGVAVY